MAQWNGQYTGNSHATKVKDLEQTLKHAIEVAKAAAGDVKPSKANAAKKLASKLLNARLKMVKAKLSEITPVDAKDSGKALAQMEHLQLTERNLTSAGIDGILFEFGADDLIDDDL